MAQSLVRWSLVPAALGLSLAVGLGSCRGSGSEEQPPVDSTGNSTQATEWVGYHTEIPILADDFHPLAAGLFGETAQAKNFVVDREIAQGVFVGARADTGTPDQSVVTLT